VVSHAFSDKALKEQEALLRSYVELLVAKITNLVSLDAMTRIDLVSWYNFTTFDIMADLTFGESLGLLEQSAYTPWVRAVFGSVKMTMLLQASRKFPALSYLLAKAVPAAVKEKKRLHIAHSIERVEKRLATPSERPDIWTYVLQYVNGEGGKSSENGLKGREMHSNAATFMLAGTETTATLLSGLTYHLLKRPDALERIVKEVRDSFPEKEDMTMASLARLEWLNACLEEGLRIYPPVPVGLPRVTPAQGAVVSGMEVPGGTLVSLHQYSAYHSPLNFKNPDMFLPERWLPESRGEFSDDNKHVFQPFSYGPRNCLGKNLAYHEMRLVLANVMWHFDLSLCEESDGWPVQDSYLLWEKHPLMVEVKSIRTK
jgi:cytochrome P450